MTQIAYTSDRERVNVVTIPSTQVVQETRGFNINVATCITRYYYSINVYRS